jgi:choice-of-anchor B domain-containing protein
MKQLLLIPIYVLATVVLVGQTPCNNGMAGPYPCNGYDLQSQLSLSTFNAGAGNDSWGWTDPQTGTEYVLMGLDNGTGFVDISDPVNPVYLGKLPTHTTSSSWRDVKVYNNYAFVVSEAGGHGMQVFDLTRLRNVTNPPQTFTEDAHYGGFGSAHNIVINEDSGYAYAVGTSNYNGGPQFINIQDPLNPVGEGGFGMDFYSHDAQVVTYNGPDADYVGREILIGSNESFVSIVDITDKSNPQGISTISYSNVVYTHQGWFTEDQKYFILGDEIDEITYGFNTKTVVFDFTDLDNPQLHFDYYGPTPAVDHNGYVLGDTYYLANYRAGMRAIDISNIDGESFTETGFFDTYPNSNGASTSGAWNVYPYFISGNIVISDISRGLFIVKSSTLDTVDPIAVCQDFTGQLDENGDFVLEASEIDGGSSDNSGFTSLSVSPDTFTCDDLGANTVTLTVTDPSGNTDTCTATVTVVDILAPLPTCPSNATVNYDNGQSYYTLPDYVAQGTISATDNCTTAPAISQSPIPGTQLTEGIYTVAFEISDDAGNSVDCSFQLTVENILSTGQPNEENTFLIFPNPFSNTLTIEAGAVNLKSIQVFDVLGKTVLRNENMQTNAANLDVSALPSGMYFVRINGEITKRVVKY